MREFGDTGRRTEIGANQCAWLLLIALLALGVPSLSRGKEPRETSTDFAYIKVFKAAAGGRTDMTLREGLPHPNAEKDLLADELKMKRTVTLDGQTYYSEQLELSPEDADRLGRLLSRGESFVPWRGGKFCGGYHADYAIEWHVGKEIYRAHVCLGCSEVKFFGEDTELYCDITEAAYEQFAALLKRYRHHRPTGD